ncbi:MAG TPA: winged helix-turn-helix domain-containing protein [Pyrinomonadaceae bacterium]
MKYEKLISESLEQLETLQKKQRLVRDEKRIRFLIYLKSGQAKTQQEAGAEVGWKLRQSQKMWQLYREKGLSGVLVKEDRRGFGKLSSRQIGQLNNYLEEFGAHSLSEIQQYLRETCGVEYTIGGLSDLCIRLRIKLKTVRPSNYRKDEAEIVEYKKTFLA